MRAPKRQPRESVSRWLLGCQLTLFRPLLYGWFKVKMQDSREWRYPVGPSEVSIAGIDPARILIMGDGPAAGFGVRTHQLGIAGHLARYVAGQTERGVVVTVAAQPGASARSTLRRFDDMEVEGYDAIVLMLATTDAVCLTTRLSWRRTMTALVHALESTDASSVFVTSAASLHLARPLVPLARRLIGRHARRLNFETRQICSQTETSMIPLNATSDFTSRIYAIWGRRIGTHVADSLVRGTLHPPHGVRGAM
ncbi:hypothetical protein SAMN05216219_0928 [Mycetocola miduiensis]|uniref:GDSL-like Lipase/Acylhydrolase family protein n=1 Tax=Mycetocola miduiensis TaxID=995034 RepID=A0A1I4ZN54_9MICO|nr:hypothetical protein SAMN05216219_0928 [Mycetocola miduiensis]